MPRFDACPADTQKCVSTLNDSGYAAFDAVPFTCTADEAFAAVKQVVEDHPRTSVVAEDGLYLATTFRTRVIRFKDSVEFEVDDEAKVVHFRSESVPFAGSDLGANRKRMTEVDRRLRVALR